MKLLVLSISGFRGIQQLNLNFGDHDVLVGPNSIGKSTIIDAMSLVFGRTRLVRDLTEHDFYGSQPVETSRIRIVATVAGFEGNDPENYGNWFREGRAVPKWWNSSMQQIEPEPSSDANTLCVQIAFAARFDLQELSTESIRYFHDDDEVEDPFIDEAIQTVPTRLYDDIGYFVLPARRTWEAAASFASELFRKAVATTGEIPGRTILQERDRLRSPDLPLEETDGLSPLVERINRQLANLVPGKLQFQLRLTATDSDSLIRALVPHYSESENVSLPVGRHGMGVLSLQTFILMLEFGRERVNKKKSFLFAIEEPELHIPSGTQRQLISRAISLANQTICTSHSPRVAAYYSATAVQILDRKQGNLVATPMLREPLDGSASNAMRKLYQDNRTRVVEALMQHSVIIPEGRTEYEWLGLLSSGIELSDVALDFVANDSPSFGAIFGLIPTQDGNVTEVYAALQVLRSRLIPLVDGDAAGIQKIKELQQLESSPKSILRWRDGWAIEDVIGWLLKGSENCAYSELVGRISYEFESIDDLVTQAKKKTGQSRLKNDYLAFEEIISVICSISGCRDRAKELLEVITLVVLDQSDNCDTVRKDDDYSTSDSVVYCLEL